MVHGRAALAALACLMPLASGRLCLVLPCVVLATPAAAQAQACAPATLRLEQQAAYPLPPHLGIDGATAMPSGGYALWAADQADALECHRAAALTKAYASANYVRVASDAIQIFGGSGFTWEVDLHLFYKRLMSLEQDWGGDDFWLDELARMVVDGEARNE